MINIRRKALLILAILIAILALSLTNLTASALTQGQVSGGDVSSDPGGARTFSLGDMNYSITLITPDTAARLHRSSWGPIKIRARTTAYVLYSKLLAESLDSGRGTGNAVVFGPRGYSGFVTWNGGNVPYYSFTGDQGQFYLIEQQPGGPKRYVIVSFD